LPFSGRQSIRSQFLPIAAPSPGARELLVPFGRSAYVVRYAHLPARDEILILRVWHGHEARD